MKPLIVSAPGKLHILGEHSVVYGEPALIAAIDRRVIVSTASHPDVKRSTREEKYIKYCLEKAFSFFGRKTPDDFHITVDSDIPMGVGMGSSASLAVAIAGLVSQNILRELDKEKINEIAFQCETYKHGNPSGGDNTACTYGGIIWYKRSENGEKIIKPLSFSISKNILSKFFIVNTGKPRETTKDMVMYVKKNFLTHKRSFEKIFHSQGLLVEELLHVFERGDSQKIREIIQKSEANLEKIGVVSKIAKAIVRDVEKKGVAAKICGAGGVTDASGIMLLFHDNPDTIRQIIHEFGLECESIMLGQEGVRVDNE